MMASSPSPSMTASSARSFSLLSSTFLLFLLLLLSTSPNVQGNDDASAMLKSAQFFRRNAKWINLPSGGGSLVSGRGNFRPGFHSSLNAPQMMEEPLFASKRSILRLPSLPMLYGGGDGFGPGDQVLAFARR